MEKKFRILTLVLIFSGALNIALIVAFIFLNTRQMQIQLPLAKTAHKDRAVLTNGQLLGTMAHLSFRELVSFLTNREWVEEGYTKRDLALAALVSFHHFNLEKALASPPPQKRTLVSAEGHKMEVFPSLNEEQFEAIIRYAYQEKWPLTAKGLFLLLQKREGTPEESLAQAFFLTPEFYALQLFLQKAEAPQDPYTLLSLVCEGNWELLERFAKEQAQVVDFSLEKRRSLLLSYLALRSPTAAQLLLRTDFQFALKRLEDRGILELLSLLKKQTEESTKFCVELLRSPRGDAIWQAAASTLSTYAGETLATPVDPKAALARFAPQEAAPSLEGPAIAQPAAPVVPAAPKLAPLTPSRFHTVAEGESLWKISRQYKVKVEELIRLNGLEKDALYPGMTLKLPQGTGSEPPR